jgi:excisionase family DNA binding protein
MNEMSVEEAAQFLGTSTGAVRRRIRRGELKARQDGRGRYVVEIDPDTPPASRPASRQAPAPASDELARMRLQLEHEREMLAEVRRQRDELAVLLDSQRAQIEAAFEAQQRDAEERAELRRLLGNAQMQLSSLLPAPRRPNDEHDGRQSESDGDGESPAPRRKWWWPWSGSG